MRNYDWGDFGAVAYLRLLENLHDSGKPVITWKIYPMFVLGEYFAATLTKWKRFESFLSIFEKNVADTNNKLEIIFSSNPKLETGLGHDLDTIVVQDYFRTIYSLKTTYDELNSIEKVVNLYDRSLPDNIHEIYLKILKALHERLLSGYELAISIDLKTKELPEYLLKFIAFDVWKDCIKDLNEGIVPRVYDILRRMFEVL